MSERQNPVLQNGTNTPGQRKAAGLNSLALRLSTTRQQKCLPDHGLRITFIECKEQKKIEVSNFEFLPRRIPRDRLTECHEAE